MSKDFRDKKLPLDKVIELGIIDRWLRGIAKIVPKPSDPGHKFTQERDLYAVSPAMLSVPLDSNLHSLAYASRDLIEERDIEAMRGFQSLMNIARQKDICVVVTSKNGVALEISFDPEAPFSRSVAFGASYSNVLPAIFGGTASRPKY